MKVANPLTNWICSLCDPWWYTRLSLPCDVVTTRPSVLSNDHLVWDVSNESENCATTGLHRQHINSAQSSPKRTPGAIWSWYPRWVCRSWYREICTTSALSIAVFLLISRNCRKLSFFTIVLIASLRFTYHGFYDWFNFSSSPKQTTSSLTRSLSI